jgi:FkbM family methyltransferase
MIVPSGCDQGIELPSRPISIDVKANDVAFTVAVPKNEIFRVNQIFQENAYAILSRRSTGDPRMVIDVGANIGLFAIYMKCIDPAARVHCFEPYEGALDLLASNIEPFQDIYVHPFGLYSGEQQARLHLHRFNSGENSIRIKDHHHHRTAAVQLRDAGATIDKLNLNQIDVLKIDTEGCEIEILESLGDRLSDIDYILIEYHSEKDRRHIDQLLHHFNVFAARSDKIGVGTVNYINSQLTP